MKDVTPSERRYKAFLKKARHTNAIRDGMEKKRGFARPADCDLETQLRTAMAAVDCGLRLQDWDPVAEGLLILQDALDVVADGRRDDEAGAIRAAGADPEPKEDPLIATVDGIDLDWDREIDPQTWAALVRARAEVEQMRDPVAIDSSVADMKEMIYRSVRAYRARQAERSRS